MWLTSLPWTTTAWKSLCDSTRAPAATSLLIVRARSSLRSWGDSTPASAVDAFGAFRPVDDRRSICEPLRRSYFLASHASFALSRE